MLFPYLLLSFPTPFIVVALIAVTAWVWAWYQRWRTERWPTISGTIEDAWSEPGGGQRNSEVARVKVRYSYIYDGATYGGEYRRGFNDEDAAREFAFGLKGRNVLIHVDPTRPKRSGLLDRDLDVVVSERGPVPEGALPPETIAPVSSLRKMVALPFAIIALTGFVLSLAVNIAGWFDKIILPSPMFAAMHIGIFVVFLPAILLGRMRGQSSRWASMTKGGSGIPSWAKTFGAIVFGYAMVNFIVFFVQMPGGKQHGAPSALMWRGFSGHWMVFYLFAFGVLYSVINAPSEKAKCVNGHEMRIDSMVCPVCGAGREQTA